MKLRMPRRETRRNTRLSQLLTRIDESEDNATHLGFVKRNSERMDMELSNIIDAAREARAILRGTEPLH